MAINGTVYSASSLAPLDGIAHGFFTREGGVSQGEWHALNCGYGSKDENTSVRENRRRVAHHLGAQHDEVVTVYQVHSATPVIVQTPFAEGAVPQADAVVTSTPGVAVGALSADCTPVLFADPKARVVAAAHAGWRGAHAGILQATVDAMETLGATRAHIHAAIGPTIHQPNYEVGLEFEAQFIEMSPDYARFFVRPTPDARPHFDLPGFCLAQLSQAGIGTMETLNLCTYENESLFYSYRRKTHKEENDYGRQISAIVLI